MRFIMPAATFAERSFLGRFMTPLLVGAGVVVSLAKLARIRPSAVVGFGGYPSLPVMIAACLEALTRPGGPAPGDDARWAAAMEEMSQAAFSHYRKNIADNAEVLEYFEQSTPVNQLEFARIGSRPHSSGTRRRAELTGGRFRWGARSTPRLPSSENHGQK